MKHFVHPHFWVAPTSGWTSIGKLSLHQPYAGRLSFVESDILLYSVGVNPKGKGADGTFNRRKARILVAKGNQNTP